MGNVVNLFSPVTEGVEDIERSFMLCDGKISKTELAEEAYDTLLNDEHPDDYNKRLASEKAWDIAAFYKLGDFKIGVAKQINLECEREYLLESRRSDVVGIPIGETKESFLKCRIENMERIKKLYFSSVVKDIDCFSGAIDINIEKLHLDMMNLIVELKELR